MIFASSQSPSASSQGLFLQPELQQAPELPIAEAERGSRGGARAPLGAQRGAGAPPAGSAQGWGVCRGGLPWRGGKPMQGPARARRIS